MKFVHTSDWHIYQSHLYGEGKNRLDELTTNLRKIVEYTEKHANILVIAGDVFNVHNPPQDLVRLFIDIISPLLKARKTVIALVGDHDTDGEKYSLQSMAKFISNSEAQGLIIPEPGKAIEVRSLHDVSLHCVSWHKDMRDLIEGIDLSPQFGKHILVTHEGVLGAITPSGYMMKKGYLDPEMLKKFDYVALGDFHKHQKITDKIHFCGAPLRFRWDEKDCQPGFNVVTVEDKISVKRVSLTDIEMIEWTVDVKDVQSILQDKLVEVDGKRVKDAIVKMFVRGRLSESDRLLLTEHFYDCGVRKFYVKSIVSTIEEAGDSDQDKLLASMSIREVVKTSGHSKDKIAYALKILEKM